MEPTEKAVGSSPEHPLRDPMGDAKRYDEIFFTSFSRLNDEAAVISHEDFELWDEMRRIGYESSQASSLQKRLIHMHARGDLIQHLISRLSRDLYLLKIITDARRIRWSAHTGNPIDENIGFIFTGHRDHGFGFCALAFFLALKEDLNKLTPLLVKTESFRFYVFDFLCKAFVPSHRLAKSYERNRKTEKKNLTWADPFARALATPKEALAHSLQQYMKAWPRLMVNWGWKPVRDFSPEAVQKNGELESLFEQFAFEVGLAVCAYDLDDSSFRDHPYYPRDLVDHYRAHVRNARDAWRAVGAGPGIEVEAPPLPPKLDLAKSKSKGLQRWLELVSDGDADATAAVLEQVGKIRKVKDSFALSCALGENDAGLCADIKDDETLAAQIDRLLDKRGLVGWDTQGLPPAGPARCSALLLALDRYLSDKPYALRALGGEDDSWQGVVVPRMFEAEFAQLSDSLAIRTANPQQAYDL